MPCPFHWLKPRGHYIISCFNQKSGDVSWGLNLDTQAHHVGAEFDLLQQSPLHQLTVSF